MSTAYVANDSQPSNNDSATSQFTPTLGCLIRVFAVDFFQRMKSNPALWGLCAFIPGLSVFLTVVSRGELKPQLFMVTLPLTVGMLPATVLVGNGDLRENYLLPVSTKRLLIARLLVAMGYMFVISLISSILVMVLVANATDWPNVRVACATAFLVPGWLMVGWAFRESTGYRVLTGVLAVIGLATMLFFVMNHNYSPQIQTAELVARGMPILLMTSFVFGVLGTFIIFLGVAVDRHGNGWVMPKMFHNLLERNSHPLLSESADPDAGLRWFQQHNVCRGFARLESGIILFTALLAILWLPGGIFSFRSEFFARIFLGILTAEYLLFSWLCGMRAATTEIKPPGNQLGTLLGILPVSDIQIARQALRTGIRTHVPATILMVVIQIVVWMIFRDKQAVCFFSDQQPTSLVTLGVQILAMLLIAWMMFASNFWTWLSGRTEMFVWQLMLSMLSLYSVGAVGLFGKTIGSIIRDTANAGVGLFLIWSTIWMFRKAKTLRLIDQSLIRKCVLAWLVTYAFLVAILWFAEPKLRIGEVYAGFRWPVIAFVSATLSSLALLPIPGARVATYWNRHRS